MRDTSNISLKKERQAKLRSLNKNIDRSPAKVGPKDDSKLRIELVTIEGRDPIVKQYSGSVDWGNQASITALNRWRKDTFYHILGPLNKQQHTTKKETFLDREISWLAAHIGVFLYQDRNGWYRGWAKLTEEFNKAFGGHVFPGDPVQWPCRSITQLRSLKYDIDVKVARGLAVIDHTRHQRHVEAGGVGGNRVMGNNRVSKLDAKDKKHHRGSHFNGYSWARLQYLAKFGGFESKTNSES